MTIEEIKQQLDFLSNKIDLVNNTVQFTITTFIAILAISIAIAGISAVILARNLFNKRFDEEVKKIDTKIDKKVKESINEINEKKADKDQLLDYEEGTWIPKLYGGIHSYLKQYGTYIRIENLIVLQFSLDLFKKDSEADDSFLLIEGLPFVFNTNDSYGGQISYISGVYTEANQFILSIEDSRLSLERLFDGSNLDIIAIRDITDNFRISGSIIYKIQN